MGVWFGYNLPPGLNTAPGSPFAKVLLVVAIILVVGYFVWQRTRPNLKLGLAQARQLRTYHWLGDEANLAYYELITDVPLDLIMVLVGVPRDLRMIELKELLLIINNRALGLSVWQYEHRNIPAGTKLVLPGIWYRQLRPYARKVELIDFNIADLVKPTPIL